jgi:NitT/TauT family transport system permease protein
MASASSSTAVPARRVEGFSLSPALAAHLFTAAILLAWAAASLVVPHYMLPSPLAVGRRILDLVTQPNLLRHGLSSATHVVLALCAAFAVGMTLAATAHYVRCTQLLIHGRLNRFLNAFSALGWTFLAIIWFGVNDLTVVFAMSAVLLPLIIINLREGFLQLDAETIEMAQSFGRRRVRHFIKITLPLLVPFIAATLRICYGVSWIICLTVELFGGNTGYGYLLNRARMEFQVDTIFAIILWIIFIVYLTDRYVLSAVQEQLRRQYNAA